MLAPGEHVVVAVSGGSDSTALLRCLYSLAPKLHVSLTVAHLNHRLRGSEGNDDEEFVRRMAADLGIPFISEAIDVRRLAAAGKRNLEELARDARYDFLRRTAHCVGAQKIAVGHNQNDQAETVLLRFLRGSGLHGLSAIHPVVDGLVIRPLLECSREKILEYLKQLGACHREDSTNLDFQHRRNRVRQELMPYLEKNFNPGIVQTLAREACLARETSALIESQAQQAFEILHQQIEDGISLPIRDLLGLHPALQKQVVRFALKKCLGSLHRVATLHIESILALCRVKQSGRRIRLPHGNVALRQFSNLLLLKHDLPSGSSFTYELAVPGRRLVPEARAEFSARICSTPSPSEMKGKSSSQAFLDPSVLPELLTIRSRAPGDRYGGSGHRKIKKMLIDSRVPIALRAALPMVAAGNDIIWIPGFRPARQFAARPGSETCVLVEIHRL
jgi:tRNA(Ile)-lysidine synthase